MTMIQVNLKEIMATFIMMFAGVLAGCAGGGGGSTATPVAAPVVILVSPANNATGALLTKPISVAFSKEMQPTTFTSSTFTVTSSSGSVIGNIAYVNGYATLTPATPMLPSTLYTATVAAGVQATDGGGALVASYSWSFTTGPYDAAFGNGGVVTTPVSLTLKDEARSVAVQADGKLVAVGYVDSGSENYDFAIVRYNIDGSLDTTFGGDGIVVTPISTGKDEARAVAIQANGQIVVAGAAANGTAGTDFVVARYNATGSLDGTFNTGGFTVTDFGGNNHDEAFAMAIQSDGKIVVVGQTGAITAPDFAVARYTASGILDTTFDTDGKQITPFGEADAAYSVAIQADGKIVVAGVSDGIAGLGINNDFVLARYDVNGALDTTFDTDGKVTTAVGAADEGAYAIGIQAGDKIVVAGVVFNGANNDFGLARYNPNGSLDATFGTGGIVITDMAGGNDAALALQIQSDNKIVVGGAAFVTGQGNDFAAVRYTIDGSLDTTFDTDGKLVTNISAVHDTAFGMVLSGSKIVLAGSTGEGASANFVLLGLAP